MPDCGVTKTWKNWFVTEKSEENIEEGGKTNFGVEYIKEEDIKS